MLLALLRCNSYREEFNRVATIVEFTMFAILKVHTSGGEDDMNTLRMMAAQVDRQYSGSLCKLKVKDPLQFSSSAPPLGTQTTDPAKVIKQAADGERCRH